MRSTEVARRYAEALYELAVETESVDSVKDAFRALVDDLKETPDLVRYLSHPMVLRDRKVALVEEVFADVPEILENLLRLVIHNQREAYLDLIYEEYLVVEADATGVSRVRVTTATVLEDDERSRLVERLSEAMGTRVRLEERLDERLLGGARLETDGKVIDGTLKARLDRLRSLLGG